MVATSQPLASAAGLRLLRAGGNAVDAALAAAAVLCVVEPMMTGLGGDLFALVAGPREAPIGLDAAGPAPVTADPASPVHARGPRSATVPGAVAGCALLAERFARFGLDRLLAGAIEIAREGFTVTPIVADWWRSSNPPGFPAAPVAGERRANPALAAMLERVADEGPQAIYGGPIAAQIAEASWLSEADLAAYRPRWVTPLRGGYRGRVVYEMPAPTQGIAALEALALLDRTEPTLSEQVRCVALALEDAAAHVRDGADVSTLLAPDRLAMRAEATPALATEPSGSTVYVAAVDGDGLCASLIQSLFHPFGSGVAVGETGIVLQSRAAGFAVEGSVNPGRRPFHTLMPALLADGDDLLGPFGVVGGSMQAQGQVQLLSALLDGGADPQAAVERPRFRIDDGSVLLERGLWDRAQDFERAGMPVVRGEDYKRFGGGQMIVRRPGGGWSGGSDPRKDGCALGM
ncbi:MAG: gamma-glutamyltransferase [Solirubrobacterales bacterium]|nr:gamma-glutamyltransferase [Solirubrobacterales bacterium]